MLAALANIISHRRAVMTLLIVALATGISAYLGVPKEADPDIDVPVFFISVTQQGISAEDSERLLVRPLETKLRGLSGLKEMSAIAGQGYAAITLEFDVSFDKDAVFADIRDKTDQAKAELPDGADEPQIFETNFSLVPTIIVVLSGTAPERDLYQHAHRLKDQIEAIPSVLEAKLSGHREELLEVIIDQLKLESYNLSTDELIAAVTRNNRLVPAGALDKGAGRFEVKVPGLFEKATDVNSIPIKVSGDNVVTLGDVTRIRRTFKDPVTFTRFNGEPAIAIEVVKRSGTNIVDNNAEVRRIVGAYTADWPTSIDVSFTLDKSTFIFEVLGSLESAIMTAIALVMIMVLASLGMRSALLVGLAIPCSFMIGFLIVGILGMTINMMVMFGMVLTVGMLVDGAIVIVEYADRKMAEGLEPYSAFLLAAQRMFWPIVSSTATTLAAFLPMLFWPGVPGEFMSYLPLMVIIVLSASLLTAMIFLPVVGSLVGGSQHDTQELKTAKALAGAARLDYNQIPGFTGYYVRLLRKIIHRPIIVVTVTCILCAATFTMVSFYGPGVEFFVDEEPEQAIVLVTARGNLSATEVRDLVVEVEQRVESVVGVKNMFVTTGPASAAQDLGAGGGADKPRDQIGLFILELEDYCCRPKAEKIFAQIRDKTERLAGIRVEVRKVEGGPPTGKHVRLEITSQDYLTLTEVTGRVRDFVDQLGGLRDIEDDRPLPGIDWSLSVDREQAGRFGSDIVTLGNTIQLMTEGLLVGTYRPADAEDEIDIRVRLPRSERNIDALDRLKVRTENGLVPLSNMIERSAQPRRDIIQRQNGRYAMLVKANTAANILADEKVKELTNWIDAQTWPSGVAFRFRGADEEQRESGAFLQNAMLASLFLMFIILVTQFNSFYQTILTLSTVILSVVGVLIGMLVTGQNFSIIMTGTGVVALAGIVVNNAIVLIDTYNRMREAGLEPIDAILRSCSQRLRPILLTTATTILGLVPMALQITVNFFAPSITIGGITSIWWVQLSTAIISGLAFSTLLTLLLIPTLLAAPHVIGSGSARKSCRPAPLEARGFQLDEDVNTPPSRTQKPAGNLSNAAE